MLRSARRQNGYAPRRMFGRQAQKAYPVKEGMQDEVAGETLGIIAALPGEARMLARLRPRGRARLAGGAVLLLSGMGAENAGAAAEQLVSEGACALMSWGVAAGLVPGINPGALILPATVLGENGESYSADKARSEALVAFLGRARVIEQGFLAETPDVLSSPAVKRALHERTGAVACDMESAAIAAVAAKHRLPFIAARAVIDDVTMVMPPVARAAMNADGRLQPKALGKALAGRPSAVHAQLRSLKNLAVAYRAARMTLTEVARWVVRPA